MDKIIQEQLMNIEKENNVKILYAVESGSRGWGFESKDSDYDVRFIYAHPTEWYLSVFEGSDIVEIPVDDILDVNGWDIKKALKLLYKSNPPLLEWMSSPIVYKKEENFIRDLRKVAENHFAPVHAIYHYINLGKKSFDGFKEMDRVRLKKLFYVIRPVTSCMWIEKYKTITPMNLQEMMRGLELDNGIRKLIDEYTIIKAGSTESDTVSKPKELIEFLEQKLNYFDGYVKSMYNDKNRDASDLNEFFQRTLKEYFGGI